MPIALRPLSTGELLDRTFSLYRSHFTLFVGIVALPHLLSLAVQLSVLVLPTQQGLALALEAGLIAIISALVGLAVAAASQAATVMAVSQVYLDRPASVMDSYSRIARRIPGIVGLTIVVGLGAGLGFILLVVPGIIFTIMWSLAVPVAVLENAGVSIAMSRSSDLTRGDRWRVFIIWLLFVVLTVTVSILLQWVIGLAAWASAGHGGPKSWVQVASVVAGFATQCVVGPLLTIALSLVYYDERVRKEAFDIELMISTIDGSAAKLAPAN